MSARVAGSALGGSVILAALLVSAGCASNPPDRAAAVNVFPDRPSNLDITRIQPCSAVSTEARKQLGLEEGKAGRLIVSGVPSEACGWQNFSTGYGYNVQTARLDAERALTDPGSTVTVINGFGAVQNAPKGLTGQGIPPGCQLTIDVNDGQLVRVQVQPGDPDQSESQQARNESCARVITFATDVMTTLVNQQR